MSAIPLARPSFDAAEERLVQQVIRSGWVAQGPRVAEFEERFAKLVGASDAVATSSCTTALFLALHAHGIGPGDEVIVPSLSFIASANAIVHCGAKPVFVDVDPRTYNLEVEQVERAVGPATRAILPVHQVGLPADLAPIEAIASDRGLLIVEDAACATGSRYRGQPIGSSRNVACFSFHPRKVVCTAEGGMITTNDPELAARLRRLRHQGMSVSDLERHRSQRLIIEEYPEIGYNFRMSDVHAALGLAQLEKLDRMLVQRRAIAARYGEALADDDRIEAPFVPEFAEPNFQSYIVRLRGADRDARNRVVESLGESGVAARPGLMAAHREAPYRGARKVGSLPHTEAATDQTLVIPMYADLSEPDQARVASALRKAVASVLE